MAVDPDDLIMIEKGASSGVDQGKKRKAQVSEIGGGSNFIISHSGRVYCYTDSRWVTNMDDNYGPVYYQWTENGGTGVDPIIEHEWLGTIIPAGMRIKGIKIAGKTSSTNITDMELMLVTRTPNPITRYETGFDSDGEMTNETLFRGMWKADVIGSGYSGAMNDVHMGTIPLDHLVDDDAQIGVLFKPVRDPANTSTTYYFRTTLTWIIGQ